MPTTSRRERIAELFATDSQFADARPSDAVAADVVREGATLVQVVAAAMEGYADRPALARRGTETVTDPDTGRTTVRLLDRLETVTYGEVWRRTRLLATALTDLGVAAGDRVAVLGFTSVDYTVVDLALVYLGAVAVPLQTSASREVMAPIMAETEPTAVIAAADQLTDATALVADSPTAAHLIVFDVAAGVDDHREALAGARDALGDDAVVELADLLERGAQLPELPASTASDDDLALLIYTSGSTGAPKGAMHLGRMVAASWRQAARGTWGSGAALPSITLNFMPMSHIMGRTVLHATLAVGGTAAFTARSDLSTFLADLALVRPTQLAFVPRVWDMLQQLYLDEVDRREAATDSETGEDAREAVLAQLRRDVLGGRHVTALTGSAPMSPELAAFVESLLQMHLVDGYGSTEAGGLLIDGVLRRPPVTDYRLVDVPELGYHITDRPHPRGELLIKSEEMFPGYYRRPEVTAEVFDADGFYRTGDIVAELGDDRFAYLDRRNNVLKLAQGEFVAVAKLEAAYTGAPLISQIYLYGNSARPYLLAVVVPTAEALRRHDEQNLPALIVTSLQRTARAAGLQPYEVPRDVLVEPEPFTVENGLLTGVRKLAWPQLKKRYGERLEALYASLAQGQADDLRALRRDGASRPTVETVGRAAGALLGASTSEIAPDAHFTDLGGDSLSALTFANLLREIYHVEVSVGVIVSPTTDIASLAAYVDALRAGDSARPTFTSVHGADPDEVAAADLTLEAFLDAGTLDAAASLPAAATDVRTVLVTGATGFLGRYLLLEWLQRMAAVGGTVVALVRARSDADARRRLDETFATGGEDGGDDGLAALWRRLADAHLLVVAGDKGEADLGLDPQRWRELARDVDLIVDPAALVNHVLPYSQLFGPNVVGTAELLKIALTTTRKPYVYVSTVAVCAAIDPAENREDADVRTVSAVRPVDDGYANGYGSSKWAGEVLLREAHDRFDLPVSVFRCDLILAEPRWAGQLNVPDMFTRMMLSLLVTGVAPDSFYLPAPDGSRARAHYDGLPVDFIAEAISTLGAQVAADGGFETYHVMNPHDDGINMDTFVDWLIDAGYGIRRVGDHATWFARFATVLRSLPERTRAASLLPLLHNYERPERPMNGALAPTGRFADAVRRAVVGGTGEIPHVTPEVVVKYATDLARLGYVDPPVGDTV